MADIKIEKKGNKGNSNIWPWIIGALVLIGIIWAIAEMGGEEEEINEVAAVEQPIVTEPQSNVIEEEESEDFVTYVEDTQIKDQMGLDHVVTGSALVKLSESLREITMNEDQYNQQLNDLEQVASQIQSDPQSLQHADKLQDAFSKASTVIQQIQQNRFPDMQSEVEEVQEASTKLEGSDQLLNQKEEVKTFFEKTADAVEKMKEEATANM